MHDKQLFALRGGQEAARLEAKGDEQPSFCLERCRRWQERGNEEEDDAEGQGDGGRDRQRQGEDAR